MSFSNPNMIYQKTINFLHNNILEINNAFDVYSLLANKNKYYLIGSSNHNRTNLDIYLFEKDFKKILSLKKHEEFIKNCKYYANVYSKKE